MIGTKFTKGEWYVKQTAPLNCAWTFDFNKMGLGFSIDGEEFNANLSLMKTAPKLYEMLDGLISNEDSNLTVNEIMMISELLAEARGE